MALGVLAYARERGLSVPEDLSVTGFDGIDAAQRLDLATVIQPNKAKGAAAGHMLEKLIAGATDTAGAARAKAGAQGADEAQAVPRRVLQTRFAPGKSVTAPRPRGR